MDKDSCENCDFMEMCLPYTLLVDAIKNMPMTPSGEFEDELYRFVAEKCEFYKRYEEEE